MALRASGSDHHFDHCYNIVYLELPFSTVALSQDVAIAVAINMSQLRKSASLLHRALRSRVRDAACSEKKRPRKREYHSPDCRAHWHVRWILLPGYRSVWKLRHKPHFRSVPVIRLVYGATGASSWTDGGRQQEVVPCENSHLETSGHREQG